MPEKLRRFVVTVADDAVPRIQQVADGLTAKGMKVNQIMPVTGVITGSYAPSKAAALKDVGGVMSVDEEAVAELPPPDSPLQ
jgi:hypothetical protein